VLDAITHVGLHVTLVVNPSDAELTNTVGDAKALNQIGLLKLGVLVVLFGNLCFKSSTTLAAFIIFLLFKMVVCYTLNILFLVVM